MAVRKAKSKLKIKKKSRFPKFLYVREGREGTNIYYISYEKIDDCREYLRDRQLMATYELRNIQKKEISVDFIDVK